MPRHLTLPFFGLLVACGGGGSSLAPATSTAPGAALPLASAAPAAPTASPTTGPTAATRISHIIILIQENRSFDTLFYGYPGADTVTSASVNGATIPLREINLEDGIDVDHTHEGFVNEYDAGKNDGFPSAVTLNIGTSPGSPPPDYAYSYVNPAEVAVYRAMASGNTLADRMFQSNSGPSYPSHQYLIAAQSADIAEVPSNAPWGCDAPAGTQTSVLDASGVEQLGPFPCFDYQTLGDLLDAKGLPWAMYAPTFADEGGAIWTAYDAVKHIRYGADWTSDIRNPETSIFTDISAGNLPAVSWVIPTIAHSDHPRGLSNTGPAWVASVVDAVGTSKYWSSTAIFVLWDDWGGWYDHVVPQQLDVMGLGYRVPLIVISPYAKHGYVSHVQHEFGSILKFSEETFGLPSLGGVDARADDFADSFNFSARVPVFTPYLSKRQRDAMKIPIPTTYVDY